jgi:multidrug efflux pump subunit AcrB
MTLPELALRNHRATLVVLAVFLFAGIIGYTMMPRREDPIVDPKEVSVYVIYPGANPEDMENLILNPLEKALKGIEDIDEMDGHTGYSFAEVHVKLKWDANSDDATDEIRAKLNELKAGFPSGVTRAEVIKHGSERTVVLQYALVSDAYSVERLRDWADVLADELGKVDGVRSAEMEAEPRHEVRVSVDPEELAQRNISLVQVVGAVGLENSMIPPGSVVSGGMEFAVRTSAKFETLTDVGNTIIGGGKAGPVYLRDVATIAFASADPTYFARFKGRPAVFVAVTQTPGSNLLDMDRDMRVVIAKAKASLPEGVDLVTVSDLPTDVINRLTNFGQNLLAGIVLVGLVILPILGVQMSIVVMVMLPLIIVITLGFLHVIDIELHQITIASLIMVLGMLVDNSIVVVQNIYRHWKEDGKPADEAVPGGANEVIWPVVASTATITTVFLAMLFITGVAGDYIRAVPLTVAFTLVASLVLSLSVAPLFVRFMMHRWKADGSRKWLSQRTLDWIQEHIYSPTLEWTLRHRGATLGVVGIVVVGTIIIVPLLGIEVFPKSDKPQFMITIETPRGTSILQTSTVAVRIEELLARMPAVDYWATNIGKGNPLIFITYQRHQESSNFAEIFVRLTTDDSHRSQAAIVAGLRKEFKNWPQAHVEVKEFVQGVAVGAPVAVRIEGDDLRLLRQYSDSVQAVLRQIPGTINISSNLKPGASDIELVIDADKARSYGISNTRLAQTLRAALSGIAATSMRVGDDDYDVVVRLPTPAGKKLRPEDLDRIYVPTTSGGQVPLRQVVTQKVTGGYGDIYHYELDRCVTIRSDLLEGYLADGIIEAAGRKLETLRLPEGYRLVYTGETEERDELFGSLTTALAVAIFIIYGILVTMFNSFRQPLVIFAAMPLAFVGGTIALFVSGNHFGFMAYVGAMSLAGIVVNNAIVLLDFANRSRKNGATVREAIRDAGQMRFAPILMTSFTTVFGLMPLALRGGPLWEPMSWTIIGGLLFSTVLTLLIVPVIYSLVETEQ